MREELDRLQPIDVRRGAKAEGARVLVPRLVAGKRPRLERIRSVPHPRPRDDLLADATVDLRDVQFLPLGAGLDALSDVVVVGDAGQHAARDRREHGGEDVLARALDRGLREAVSTRLGHSIGHSAVRALDDLVHVVLDGFLVEAVGEADAEAAAEKELRRDPLEVGDPLGRAPVPVRLADGLDAAPAHAADGALA